MDVSQNSGAHMVDDPISSDFQNLIFDPNTNIKLDSEADSDIHLD